MMTATVPLMERKPDKTRWDELHQKLGEQQEAIRDLEGGISYAMMRYAQGSEDFLEYAVGQAKRLAVVRAEKDATYAEFTADPYYVWLREWSAAQKREGS